MTEVTKAKKMTIRRRIYWFVNALLYYLLKLNFFRKDNIWLYGCWEGKQYDDNSRYLFEYMNLSHPEIRSIWISKEEKIVQMLNEKGLEAYQTSSLKGLFIQLKAGVFFFTNGIDDIGDISLIHGAIVIGLWHGTGMKNVYYKQAKNNKSLRLHAKKIKDRIYSDIYQDYAIATSDMAARMRAETYGLKMSQLMITGQPRNDAFKKTYTVSNVLKSLSNADEYKYILYMPTFRPYESSVIQDFIVEVSKDKSFVDFLLEKKICFLLKLHYMTNIDKRLVTFPFVILNNEDISSVQELLAVSDYLITDYSGCCIDFALRKKPIYLYAPDYEQYCKEQGIKEEWYSIYKDYSFRNAVELELEVISNVNHEKTMANLYKIINSMYENVDISGSVYSENVYRAVAKVLQL